jgi:hypothetical protein
MHVNLDGRTYVWDGRAWCDAETYLTPPDSVLSKLNRCLPYRPKRQRMRPSRSRRTPMGAPATSRRVARTRGKPGPRDERVVRLLAQARRARRKGDLRRADAIVREALECSPGNLAALAMLCSVLRARRRPAQALKETDPYRTEADAPLLTSRAAAYCDLGRWGSAKREIARALAMNDSEQAMSVMRRIKAARPDLY